MTNSNNHRRLNRFCWLMTRHRLAVLLLVSIATVAFSYGAFKIRGEVILQDMFPYDHPYLKLHARFSQVFGSGGSGVAIALRAKDGDIFNQGILSKLQKMTNEIVLWDGVYRALTVWVPPAYGLDLQLQAPDCSCVCSQCRPDDPDPVSHIS